MKSNKPSFAEDQKFSEFTRAQGPKPVDQVTSFRQDEMMSRDQTYVGRGSANKLPFNAQPFAWQSDPKYNKQRMNKLQVIHEKIVKEEIKKQSNNFFSPFEHKLGGDYTPSEDQILARERRKFRQKLEQEYQRTLNNQRNYTIVFANAKSGPTNVLQLAGGLITNPLNPHGSPYQYPPGYIPPGYIPPGYPYNPYNQNGRPRHTEDTPLRHPSQQKQVHFVAPDFFSQITQHPRLQDVQDRIPQTRSPRIGKARAPVPSQPRPQPKAILPPKPIQKWGSKVQVQSGKRAQPQKTQPQTQPQTQKKESKLTKKQSKGEDKKQQKKVDKKVDKKKQSKKELGTFAGQSDSKDVQLIETLEREVMDRSPGVKFQHIADLATAKSLLQQAVLLPLMIPQYFKGIRQPWKGILLFGPPGTGKTLLAKAVSSMGNSTFFNVSASTLASKWKGDSEKLMRLLFQMARYYGPSIIFFDEIDSLASKRGDSEGQSSRKVKTELLVQMDGANSQSSKNVTVIAATNRPWDLDQALRRRLQKRIYIPLPSEQGRKQLFEIYLREIKLAQDVSIDSLVKQTKGFSGADVNLLCREAALIPMRRQLKKIGGVQNITDPDKLKAEVQSPLKMEVFKEALGRVNRSVGKQDLSKYDDWMKQFGST